VKAATTETIVVDTIVVGITAFLAFLASYGIVLGLLGRATFDAPRCGRCGIGVRPFAWSSDGGAAALTARGVTQSSAEPLA